MGWMQGVVARRGSAGGRELSATSSEICLRCVMVCRCQLPYPKSKWCPVSSAFAWISYRDRVQLEKSQCTEQRQVYEVALHFPCAVLLMARAVSGVEPGVWWAPGRNLAGPYSATLERLLWEQSKGSVWGEVAAGG